MSLLGENMEIKKELSDDLELEDTKISVGESFDEETKSKSRHDVDNSTSFNTDTMLFECSSCGTCTHSGAYMLRYGPRKEPYYTCLRCCRKFPFKTELALHMSKCKTKKIIGHKQLVQNFNLEAEQVNPKNVYRTSLCRVCSGGFVKRKRIVWVSSSVSKSREGSDIKNYQCNVCHVEFPIMQQLINHRIKHITNGKTRTDKLFAQKVKEEIVTLTFLSKESSSLLAEHMDIKKELLDGLEFGETEIIVCKSFDEETKSKSHHFDHDYCRHGSTENTEEKLEIHFVDVHNSTLSFNPLRNGINVDAPEAPNEVCLSKDWLDDNSANFTIETMLFECASCGIYTHSGPYMLRYGLRRKPYMCLQCYRKFPFKSALALHMNKCNARKITGYEQLIQNFHLEAQQVNPENIYRNSLCRVCTGRFVKRKRMVEVDPLIPSLCEGNDIGNYQCNICRTEFVTMQQLINHKIKHFTRGKTRTDKQSVQKVTEEPIT